MSEVRRRLAANHFVRYRKPSQLRGWSGWCYRLAERLVPVTRSSPLRRAVQAAALLLFLFAFFYVCWPYSRSFDSSTFTAKESYKVELFLLLDPLVGVSTLLAGRYFNPATFAWTIGILIACFAVPRGFCGYLCPLGTAIDLFDWLVGRRFRRFQWVKHTARGRWVYFKYYLLASVLVSSLCGVLFSGFVSAIPVLTRGMLFTVGRLQLALLKGRSQLGPVDATFYASVAMFLAVFALSLLGGRRFWCRYVCPSGALLSIGNFLRIGQRQVNRQCIECGRCVEVCPFDAINRDFTTRTSDCTYCQACGGTCPTQAIQFVSRWSRLDLKPASADEKGQRKLSRRSFVAATAVAAAAAVTVRKVDSAAGEPARRPIRPPGSVPESLFLDLCIRCGQCFKVCPGPVLHPSGLDHGWESLWTPVAHLEHAGCHQDCNFCTLVCPTGAIQPLTVPVKRKVHIGLARIDTQTCLPHRSGDRRDCDLCYFECQQAGYHAIEMREIHIELDPPPPEGMFSEQELLEMSRIMAPVVNADACVGCGICQYRCHTTYVKQHHELAKSAIVVVAENEHRLRRFPSQSANLPAPGEPVARVNLQNDSPGAAAGEC